MKLTKWNVESTAEPEEIELMVDAVAQELHECEPGDWTMNIDPAAGVLVIGVIEANGKPEIFQCKIEESNVDSNTQLMEAELSRVPKQEFPV